jgi:hypothetical protein
MNAQPVLYPLHNGDTWQYRFVDYLYINEPTVYSYRVSSDTTIGANSYKIIMSDKYISDLVRQTGDSVFYYRANKEVLFYDFSKSIGDTISSTSLANDTMDIVLTGITVDYYFGAWRRVWSFYVNQSRHSFDDEYTAIVVDNIGIVRKEYNIAYSLVLDGALINGKVYGYFLGVHHNTGNVPNDFVLLPNFPNPFNPTTTIRFVLASTSDVTIEIFNSIGQSVNEITNSKMSQGQHQFLFDASRLASGVYYYRVSTPVSTKVGKMVLEK